MNRMTKWTACLVAVMLSLSLAACGGEEAPSEVPSSEAASQSEPVSTEESSQVEENSQAEESGSEPASSQEPSLQPDDDRVEMTGPNTQVTIRLPGEYSEIADSQDNALMAASDDQQTFVMLLSIPLEGADGAAVLEEMQQEYQQTMSAQLGTQPVEQEALDLPFAENFYGELYQGMAGGLAASNYIAYFTTDTSVVCYQITSSQDKWDTVFPQLLDCLSTYQEN